jgi:hypothetical protein
MSNQLKITAATSGTIALRVARLAASNPAVWGAHLPVGAEIGSANDFLTGLEASANMLGIRFRSSEQWTAALRRIGLSHIVARRNRLTEAEHRHQEWHIPFLRNSLDIAEIGFEVLFGAPAPSEISAGQPLREAA